MRLSVPVKALLLVSAVLVISQARADICYDPATGRILVGAAEQFTVLTAGDVNYTNDTLTGPSLIQGNVGVGGSGNFSMSDGDIYGDVYLHHGGKFTKSGPARHHGSVINDADTVINAALASANWLSDCAWMEMATSNYTVMRADGAMLPPYASGASVNITNVNQSITLTAGPNQKVVLKLTDFVMSAGTFTLQGTATTTFIINIAGKFSLNNAKILLSGVPAANVLFNIRGSGSQVSLNQGTQMSGILLALKRKVDLSGGKVYGRVIADQVNITSGGQVISQ